MVFLEADGDGYADGKVGEEAKQSVVQWARVAECQVVRDLVDSYKNKHIKSIIEINTKTIEIQVCEPKIQAAKG